MKATPLLGVFVQKNISPFELLRTFCQVNTYILRQLGTLCTVVQTQTASWFVS